ncbi:hypothetical protein KY366_05170 [Candidatus Woesearchaeota archaeon]|nr:hypothetical protein [Candidatus Woesearchaeota archaeon]
MQKKIESPNPVENIKLELEKYTNNSYLTHNFHPYPAKFIPQIPRNLIINLSNEGDWILDPFCGCGTTLVESKLLKRNSIGVDINPLSTLISKVKTKFLSPNKIKIIQKDTIDIIDEIKNDKVYGIPLFYNINHWFKMEIQEALSVIRHHIDLEKDEDIKDFLKIAFSAIINKVSNQDSDTRYAAINKIVTKQNVIDLFQRKVYGMIERLNEFMDEANNNDVIVYSKDSTNLDYINKKIDLAITSPPYMNSYDYYLYHKHRMNWLSMDYRTVQDKEFGSRNKHNDNGLGLESYNNPIKENAISVNKILKEEGYYCIVVGDAILKGKLIKMNDNFDKIFLNVGYKKIREIKFDQRKYTRTFTPNIKKQYKDSYVLIYQKN